ncbi:MAG: RdgB/HAM1 family non-canonical purine NTP pyrophosphatase [Acidobacteria bacterium]|nr:RdgB/HAM1 family non-canonical purine NTP pyrophosphatase [Acidobacteriota bacterium]
MLTLYCATTNAGKLREFLHAAEELAPDFFRIEPLPGLKQIPAPDETGDTFEANAVLKAVYYSQYTPELMFAEDSGLEVDALNGAPGVHSARFSGPDATDEKNNRLMLDRMRGVAQRTARYVCTIALVQKGQVLGTFRGTVEGEMIDEERGSNGFGYDPMFYCPAFHCTFGEATTEQKLEVSHRGEATRKMLRFLKDRATADPAQQS